MKLARDLESLLQHIDGRGYPAYKDTKGFYQFSNYELNIEHVQGDPFASPSRVNVKVRGKQAGFSNEFYKDAHRRVALCDFLLRKVYRAVSEVNFKAKGSGKSGLISVSRCGEEILERTACSVDTRTGDVKVRFSIGFPARGRTIDSMELKKILFTFLPKIVSSCLFQKSLTLHEIEDVVCLADDQKYIREELKRLGLVAFVADGSILPRENGVSDKPLKNAVAFQSPESCAITLELPHKGAITGMGIKKGITVIAGGGYHGKSTLLKALESGVYNHRKGDGREYVITDDTAVKIRAEDGRSMKNLDISLFINHLPNGIDTTCFSTENASGSTSQAGNIIEAMEAGTHLFLIDEDTSATNFMIRDELMQRVIAPEKEPITTFTERVEWLYQKCDISTILVIGSSGVFFHVADLVLQMDSYRTYDITEKAKKEAQLCTLSRSTAIFPSLHRVFLAKKEWKEDGRIKLKASGLDTIFINKEAIDIRYLEQIMDCEQVNALGAMFLYLETHCFNGKIDLMEAIDQLLEKVRQDGLESIYDGAYLSTDLAMPRRQEIFACVNRYRRL